MTATVIRVDHLSKQYRLGVRARDYGSLRESLANAARLPLRRLRGDAPRPSGEYLWALRDISFDVAAGETLAIIGRNGAGKSTILKILSRITRPTHGWAEIRGRVGSLLEVGTGFHPELTGRENVYLNGAILGMRRTEITRRFDEIVEFAEIEGFLDTPVKRYSSGMRVRLAFAVAAHLEPEVLIVDEVLAVGDLAFQRKCLGKMGEVTAEGRTVLFVSHNMSVVQALCRRGILLEHGVIAHDAPVADTVGTYLAGLEAIAGASLLEREDRGGWQVVRVASVDVMSLHPSGTLITGAGARFRFELTGVLSRMSCVFTVHDTIGNPVMTLDSRRPSSEDQVVPHAEHDAEVSFVCDIDELPLVPGRYRIDVAVHGGGHRQDEIEAAAFFDVSDGLVRDRPVPAGSGPGPVVVPHRWRTPALERELNRGHTHRDAVDAD